MAGEIICNECEAPITGTGPTSLAVVVSSYLIGAEIPLRLCKGCVVNALAVTTYLTRANTANDFTLASVVVAPPA